MVLEALLDGDPDIGLLRVLRDDGSADPATDPLLPEATVRRAYREMRRLRSLDARMILLQRQGRVGFYGAAQGQEAVPIATGLAVAQDDWVFPALREQSVMLVRGFPLRAFVAQVFGNSGDVLKGRQMPSHHSGRAVHQVSWSSCIGPQLSAGRRRRLGDAGPKDRRGRRRLLRRRRDQPGRLPRRHELRGRLEGALRARLPEQPLVDQRAGRAADRVADLRGEGARLRHARRSRRRQRSPRGLARSSARLSSALAAGGGPTFIEAVTYRMGAHSTSDDPSRYRSQAEVDAWARRTRSIRLRRHLVRLGLVSEASDAELEAELTAEIAAAIERGRGDAAAGARIAPRATSTPSCPGTCASSSKA